VWRLTFKNHRLDEVDVPLSQVMSQMTAPNLLTVSEDLLQTKRMTIEDLIESTEVVSISNISKCSIFSN